MNMSLDSLKKRLTKYKYIYFHIALFISLVVWDQLCKHYARQQLLTYSEGGVLGFSLQPPIENYGLFLGLNFGADHLLVKTSLTAVFCLFLFYYIISLIFIPKNLSHLQTGITILFSGFSSNFISKFINSYTLDFIKWSPLKTVNIYFNLADIFQTFAWFLILSQLLFLKKYIWKKNEQRGRLLILRNYQTQFIAYCLSAFVLVSAFFILINYQFLALIEVTDFANIRHISSAFFKYSLFILFSLCFFVTLFFLYISNKIYGPIYAFEKHIKALLNRENPKDLKFRKNDQLKNLEKLAKDIKQQLNSRS